MDTTKKAYSQLIAPFKRVTDAPLELDFKFDSLDELKAWAATNAHILHAGLLKVVENPDTHDYDFYSFREVASTSSSVVPVKQFEVVKLLSVNDISSMETELGDIVKEITAIWGVNNPENIDERYNSIAKLAEKIISIDSSIREIKSLNQVDKAIIGYTGDDLIEYLTTLRYGSITAVNNVLDEFLNHSSVSGKPITTWKDLQSFLNGYTTSETLKDIINEVTGGSITFVDSDTVQVEVLPLKTGTQVKHSVKLGKGVTDDDLNNRDNNFIILKNGGLFYNMQINDTGKALRFKCNGNIVHIFEYEDIINAKIDDQTEGLIDIKDIYYDQVNEQIVVIFNTKKGEKPLRIPMSIIIREWEPLNITGEPVKLSVDQATGEGKDQLRATLQVSTEKGNLVEKKASGLYVSNKASDLAYKNSTVYAALEKAEENASELTRKLEEQKAYIDSQLDGVEDNVIKVVESKITEEVRAQVSKVEDQIDDLEREVNNLSSDLRNQITNINTTISTLERKHDTDKAALEASIQSTKDLVDDLEKKHDTDKAATDAAIQTANTAIEATNKAIETLEQKHDADKVELQGLIQSAKDEALKAVEDLKTELVAQIAEMETNITNKIAELISAHVDEYHTWVDSDTNTTA